MELRLVARHVKLDEDFRESVERRVRFALRRFESRIAKTTVVLSDINGPRGGEDQLCRIVINLAPRGIVSAEATAASTLAAIDSALDRVCRRLVRLLEGTRNLQRRRRRAGKHAASRHEAASRHIEGPEQDHPVAQRGQMLTCSKACLLSDVLLV